jgi:hypothetical protein
MASFDAQHTYMCIFNFFISTNHQAAIRAPVAPVAPLVIILHLLEQALGI